MLDQSFVILPGVRERKEQCIWSGGVHSWDDFLGASRIKGLSGVRKALFDERLKVAKARAREEDGAFFHSVLRRQDHWRLYDLFRDDAVFLDIETDGYYGGVTVVGLYDGKDTKTFVRGFNLDRTVFLRELSRYKMLITFNGASFDLPVLERYFGFKSEVPHIDLRFVCQKVGLVGGLKAIEREIGLRRRREVEGFTGEDAVYLWQMWKSTGERDYLEKLVWYNEEDIINLQPLAKKVIPQLWAKVREGARSGRFR